MDFVWEYIMRLWEFYNLREAIVLFTVWMAITFWLWRFN
jgi:hypothetical protein